MRISLLNSHRPVCCMDSGSALVVYGSTGRRVQLSKQDLSLPDSVRGRNNFGFFEKQWEAVAAFWFNRVLKDTSLQHKTREEVVELIVEDIEKRWQKRKADSLLHKKRRRLLAKDGPAGVPSAQLLLTNMCSLSQYESYTEEEREEFLKAILDRVQACANSKVSSFQVLCDSSPPESERRIEGGEQSSPAPTEEGGNDSSETFDDRVAFTCEVESEAAAATAIARLHGAKLNGRPLLCRFWSDA